MTRTVNGSIRMTIPKSLAGNPAAVTKFTSVTGYAFSQRGPLLPMAAGQPNPSSLPQQVDASGAATYVMGHGGPQFDGVVEVSIDDSSFTAPRSATLGSDISQSGWQLVLGGSHSRSRCHTIYVRQRINGRVPSARSFSAVYRSGHNRTNRALRWSVSPRRIRGHPAALAGTT